MGAVIWYNARVSCGEVAPDGAAELAGSARLPAWFTLRSACTKEGEGEVAKTAFG